MSVIVPAYNAEDYIALTLRSIQQQVYSNLEIIVVDDGSTDRTGEIAELERARDARIVVLRTANGGVASARNTGLAAASGDYVAFIDADDIWHERKIEHQLAALSALSPEWGAVYALNAVIDPQGHVIRYGTNPNCRGYILSRLIVGRFVANGSNMLLRREAALAVGGYEPAYARLGMGGCEDLDFELRIAARYKMETLPEYLVGYRIHPASMSSNRAMMAASSTFTVRRHLALNKALDRDVRREALAGVFGYAMGLHLAARQRVDALDYYLQALWHTPSIALRWIAPLLLGTLRRRLRGIRGGPAAPPEPFRLDGPPLRGAVVASHIAALERLRPKDEALAAALFGPGADPARIPLPDTPDGAPDDLSAPTRGS